jgi:hypothetical protein
VFEQSASGRPEAEWGDTPARPALAAVPDIAPRRRRRNVVIALVVAAFVAVNGWLAHDIVATNSHAHQLHVTNVQTQAQLSQARADSAELKTTINHALATLQKHTKVRDSLHRDAAKTRAEAASTSAELKGVLARIKQQHGQLGPLSSCVTTLQGALNALSGGDTASATWTLATVDAACKSAGQ